MEIQSKLTVEETTKAILEDEKQEAVAQAQDSLQV